MKGLLLFFNSFALHFVIMYYAGITVAFDVSVCKPKVGTTKDECLDKIQRCLNNGFAMKYVPPLACPRFVKKCVRIRGRKRRCRTVVEYFNNDNGCQCANYVGYILNENS